MSKKKEASQSQSIQSKSPHVLRIQTAEGWKRSQLRKHKSSKGASKG